MGWHDCRIHAVSVTEYEDDARQDWPRSSPERRVSTTTRDFGELEAEFDTYVGAINHATMVTVDAENRPRTRVLIPVWEKVDGRPLGWLATYRTPVKEHVWDLYRRTSPRGAGYPLGNFWTAPSDPKLHVLRLTPWRIQVIRGADLRSRIWRVA